MPRNRLLFLYETLTAILISYSKSEFNQINIMKKNPLTLLWNIFSTILGLIGIISLTEDLILWKRFIPKIISSYQTIIYYPFSIINFQLNNRIIAYLFIGTICGFSFIKAIDFGEKNKLVSSHGYPKSLRIFYFLIYFIFRAYPFNGVLI